MSERKPFLLRLPPDLHHELRAWADADLRSLNGQIEFLLRDAVRRRKQSDRRPPGGRRPEVREEDDGGADD